MEIRTEHIQGFLTGGFGRELEVYPVIDSTNNAAKLLAKNGAPHGAAVVARRQTAGKGRLGRSFYSPDSAGAYLTVILRPQLSAEQSLLLTAAAAVSTARAIESVAGLRVQIKWVNDLYYNGKKLCGILAESALGADGRLDYLVMGIGVNVLNGSFPPELSGVATSLAEAGCGEVDCNRLLAAMLDQFEAVYNQLDSRSFLEEYRRRSCVIGKTVTMLSGGTAREVRALGINGDAHLLVETADGERLELSTGEVSLKGDWR